jgi:chemotaxis methyl-accepting protein methylase
MRLLVTTLLLFSLSATAGEVTEFKPRPAAVEEGTDTYVGILLSEEDFRKLLQDKIDTNAKVAECNVDKEVCTKLQEQYKLSIKNLQETIQRDNTWFKRNKGALALLSGLVIGVGTSIAIVKAVHPGQ